MSIRKSFSLIEVLIFVTILSLLLIASAAIVTVSMRQNTLKINMLRATHYNEQLLDGIREQKESDWSLFATFAGDNTYCFKEDDLSSPFEILNVTDCPSTLGGMYRRYAVFKTTLSPQGPTQVDATVNTSWQDAGNNFITTLHTLFTIWE